ncbi:MAG TPA: hypothetical protein ENJ07_04420 [Gammaproteobacteria bacterium]|nr:hypothetical protein [Gammaproteobacteria bacterium]
MSKRLVAGAFMGAVLISGCAQISTQNLSSHIPSKTAAGHITESLSQQEIIDQIMFESGMDESIEQIGGMAAMGSKQPPPPMVKIEDYEKFTANIAQVLDPVAIRKIIVDYLNENYEEKPFSEFLAFLKTPLAQEMTALELAAQMPEAQQEMMRTRDTMMREVSPRRLAVVRQIDDATGATETMVDMQMMMGEIVQRNMNKIMPREHRMPEAQLEQMLEQGRMQSMFPARQYIEVNMVYAYRSVDDETLNDYLEVYQSEMGQWATKLFKNAWMTVSENIGNDMAELMESTFIETNAG